jgi:hypothetical protein
MLELPSLVTVSLGRNIWQDSSRMVDARKTYPRTVRRLSIFFIVVPHFVEVVLVELSNETRKVAVFEMLGKDMLCELLILSLALTSWLWPARSVEDVPLVPQNCRHRFPIALRFHRSGSPASYRKG